MAPLKPRNAFNFFGAAQTEFPDGTTMTDRMKLVAQRWAALPDKTQWEKMAADDKAR